MFKKLLDRLFPMGNKSKELKERQDLLRYLPKVDKDIFNIVTIPSFLSEEEEKEALTLLLSIQNPDRDEKLFALARKIRDRVKRLG